MKFFDEKTGWHSIHIDEDGVHYSRQARMAAPVVETALTPDAALMLAWGILRDLRPGLLRDPFMPPKLAPVAEPVDQKVVYLKEWGK